MDFDDENELELDLNLSKKNPNPNLNPNPPSFYRLMNVPSSSPSAWFEIRLFYVRISPCAVDIVPDHLTLRHLRREIGVSLEINGSRIPASEAVSISLRRDRVDRESSEVTYVSTDGVRVTGPVDLEVYEKEDLILCGSLERLESPWSGDSKTGWTMDCYSAAASATGSSSFFQPKLGISSPSIEVYVAGCCSGSPLILTKTVQFSPRRKPARHGTLDAIPEDDETGRDHRAVNGLIHRRNLEVTEREDDECDAEDKIVCSFYPEGEYIDEDGQLSWFNAGVRVGVGIGLGMCLGIGIGVGLLMRSYQATTRTFRRRFF